jgi:4,5:9,10-diseco-3-hydroxy-5,9,17-trioxoandrosta-1(10),2-diene-4-oate hydrolase
MVYDRASISDELVEQRHAVSQRPEILANPPRMAADATERELSGRWGAIENEALVVWGRDDRAKGFDAALFLLQQMPNAQVHIFPKCGHWAQLEQAAAFNNLVLSFLQPQRQAMPVLAGQSAGRSV